MAGPFYFAWIDQGAVFNDAIHNREDELIFSFEIKQTEGDFATLTIEIANPRVGLLAPSRKTWCWFSWFDGVSIVPLFTGRLIGIPDSIINDVVTLVFIARPVDFDTVKAAFAETLKVAPYYNASWIAADRQSDPDTVLEGYTRLWNIDRVSLALTTTDIIVGEDGVISLTPLEMFYDSLYLSIGQVPISTVNVTSTVNWDQIASGSFQLNTGTFNSPAAHKLLSDWPKPGTSLDGGWTVKQATAIDVLDSEHAETSSLSTTYTNNEKEHASGDMLSITQSNTQPVNYAQVITPPTITAVQSQSGRVDPFADPPVNIPVQVSAQMEWTKRYIVETTLRIGYSANRSRSETIKFSVSADFQRIVTEPANDEIIDNIEISTDVAASPRSHYFSTDDGIASLEYLICIARARLLARCRSVEITIECRFESSINFSCRKNFYLQDDRLPGGEAVGKIKEYSLSGNGDTGAFVGRVTMASAIGTGGAIVGDPGEPIYVNDGYVNYGYQFYENSLVVLDAGDIAYSPPISVISDDGLVFPLSRSQAIILAVKSTASYRLRLRPVDGGPFTAIYPISVGTLIAPRQIDLEAA